MQESDSLRELVEKDRIAAVIHRLFVGTDAHDWDAVRECLADSVLFDMTSLAGGEPAHLTPRQITEAWEAGRRPIEAIHQQAGNLIERGDQGATASCYGIAYHFRRTASGRNTRVFVGSYDFRLRREVDDWKIDLFRFNVKFVDGNLELEKEPGLLRGSATAPLLGPDNTAFLRAPVAEGRRGGRKFSRRPTRGARQLLGVC